MSNVLISPACLGDIPDLINIAITSYNQHYTYLWHDNGVEYVAKNFSERTIRREMKEAGAAFYMIYFQNELSGFLKLKTNADLDGYSESEGLELERIYLVKDATGNGVGQQVIDFTLEVARKKNKRVVWLKAMDSSHEAIRFYEKAGFEKCATFVLDKPKMKEELRGMYVMKLELSAAEAQNSGTKSTLQKDSKQELCIG